MNVSIICSNSTNSYVNQRKKEIEYITKLLKKNPNIEITHAKTDNWIKINNKIINAITREDIQKIYKSLDINMPEKGGQ